MVQRGKKGLPRGKTKPFQFVIQLDKQLENRLVKHFTLKFKFENHHFLFKLVNKNDSILSWKLNIRNILAIHLRHALQTLKKGNVFIIFTCSKTGSLTGSV